jgi:hypothetical protein
MPRSPGAVRGAADGEIGGGGGQLLQAAQIHPPDGVARECRDVHGDVLHGLRAPAGRDFDGLESPGCFLGGWRCIRIGTRRCGGRGRADGCGPRRERAEHAGGEQMSEWPQ